MKLPVVILMLLLLVACNMPSPAFRGVAPTRISVDGSTFDVRIKGNAGEAMRINAQYAPRFGVIQDRASRAMAQVSGCKVLSVTGDQALAFGRLKCSGQPLPRKPVKPVPLECEPVRGSEVKEVGQVRIDLDCRPA